MKYFIIKRTWRIHNYGQKCDIVNYLTGPAYASCYGAEYWQPDINKAFIFDDEPLKKYLGEDSELTAKSYYPEGDFVDKAHLTPDDAYLQEHIEVEVENETITTTTTIESLKIKKVINK